MCLDDIWLCLSSCVATFGKELHIRLTMFSLCGMFIYILVLFPFYGFEGETLVLVKPIVGYGLLFTSFHLHSENSEFRIT